MLHSKMKNKKIGNEARNIFVLEIKPRGSRGQIISIIDTCYFVAMQIALIFGLLEAGGFFCGNYAIQIWKVTELSYWDRVRNNFEAGC